MKKSPGPDGFTGIFYQHLKLTLILSNSPHKINEVETLPNPVNEVSITLILKPAKDTTRKLQADIHGKYRCKVSTKY